MTIDQALKLAMEAHAAGNLGQAESLCRQVLGADPNHAGAMHFLGILADQSGRYAEAIDWLQRAIALNPTIPQFHANLGRVLTTLGRFDQATAAIEKSIAMNPNDHRGYQNLSVALGRQNRREEALAACRKTLALKPDDPEAHWNLALALLKRGDYEEGWNEFEWRLAIPRFGWDRAFSQPRWKGEDISGKTLLLHAEGGLGDALQFVRYVPMLRDRKARLILECPSALVRLFSQIAGPEKVIARGQPLADFDFHIPLQSLPRLFGTRVETIPSAVPYLNAPPERNVHWAKHVAGDGRLRIGLNWAGGGIAPSIHDGRSLLLTDFAPLAQVPGIRFHSLQVGPAAAQPRPGGLDVIDHAAELHDFAETAALMEQMDLIITVDTSVPHLAGALGRPVWVLMPFDSDFRWLMNRPDSPWYPTMRLFQQTKRGNWETPMNAVVKALQSFQRK